MDSYIIYYSKIALELILVLSAPAVIVSMVIGLIISLIQATTQVQEQTLTFVPKLVAVIVVLAVTGPWCMQQLVQFTLDMFDKMPLYIR